MRELAVLVSKRHGEYRDFGKPACLNAGDAQHSLRSIMPRLSTSNYNCLFLYVYRSLGWTSWCQPPI